MGCNGHPIVKTPNMDRLAAMGVNFRNTYAGDVVCCPSRASLMTGMYSSDVGSYCNATAFDGRFPTWGHRLRDGGYHTWATGKLDLAPNRDLGFIQVDTDHGNFIEPDITSLFRRPVGHRVDVANSIDGGLRKKPHRDIGRVNRALQFLAGEATQRRTPWVMYLGIEQPKSWDSGGLEEYLKLYPEADMPLPQIPPGHLGKMHEVFRVLRNFQGVSYPFPDDRVRRARAAYYARVTEVDAVLGRLMDRLEEAGTMDDTLIVYTSDHGEMLGEHGLWFKNSLLEASARVPLIMAGPGLPHGVTVETAVGHVDLVATLLDAGGIPRAPELRGRSLLPLAHGEAGEHPGYAITESNGNGNYTGCYMVRMGDWKYIYCSYDKNLLFNLKDDPGEFNNLAGDTRVAAVQGKLHNLLTARIEPDAITEQAFEEQERRLRDLVNSHSADGFRRSLAGRLGRGQAAVITQAYYSKSPRRCWQ